MTQMAQILGPYRSPASSSSLLIFCRNLNKKQHFVTSLFFSSFIFLVCYLEALGKSTPTQFKIETMDYENRVGKSEDTLFITCFSVSSLSSGKRSTVFVCVRPKSALTSCNC